MDDQRIEQDPLQYIDSNSDTKQHSSESDTKQEETVIGLKQGAHSDDDDDDEGPIKRAKKRVQKFSDSESDDDKENKVNIPLSNSSSSDSEQDSACKTINPKPTLKIRNKRDSSDSDSSSNEALKNEQQQLRMKNKRNKLKDKFKSLVTSRMSETQVEEKVNSQSGSESDSNSKNGDKAVNSHRHSDSNGDDKEADSSGESDQEETSIEKIKQNIKQKTSSYKTTICDPDTSDEESHSTVKSMPQKKKERKATKLTSPKAVRMTAKQAMENMKKIKSESNRMLREKEVTLPYHRPKALSLKDIMSRRRPAVSSDGKSLPIKMNEDQLRQYAKQLEERQKEMMELCKSDTDEDPDEGVTQPEKSDDNEKINQSEIPEQTQDNQASKLPETMETDDLMTNSIDITLVKTNDGCVNEDEGKDNFDNASTEIEPDKVEVDSNVSTLETVHGSKSELKVVEGSKIDKNSEDEAVETIVANNSMNSTASDVEMSLVYNDSIEECDTSNKSNETILKNENDNLAVCKENTEKDKETETDSQLVSLHYDTEKTEINSENKEVTESNDPIPSTSHDASDIAFDEVCKDNEFSDDDMINMDEIDNLIENAEILKDDNTEYTNSPLLVNDSINSRIKPKLTGAPGMIIDLDGTNAIARNKLTGLELLKERFTYFSKLKTPEELEREKEKRLKPGAQHLKLKQDLEEKIAEQRSLEWAKRLEEEKQQQMEMNALRGDESEDDIEKIEAKLEENDEPVNGESSESEESEEEMQEIEEKPRKRNPMIDDEAEESDVEEDPNDGVKVKANDDEEKSHLDNDPEDDNDEDSEDSSDESSESEEEAETTTKRGRILKAFEDSDEEEEKADSVIKDTHSEAKAVDSEVVNHDTEKNNEDKVKLQSQAILDSQDEDLQLAQLHKSFSEDLFTSQESGAKVQTNTSNEEPDIGTQTFSILNDATESMAMDLDAPEAMTVISETQPNDHASLEAVVGMCSGSFSQNLVDSQFPSTGMPVGDKLTVISEMMPQSQPNDEPNLDAVVGMCSGSFSQSLMTTQPSESQPIGEDILNLCTGKFYDNQFVSQANENDLKCNDTSLKASENVPAVIENESDKNKAEAETNETRNNTKPAQSKIQDDNNLKSILDELNDPEFEEPKPKKYFVDNTSKDISNTQYKKKFIIDSDDDTNNDETDVKKKKKIKKKKLEKRALQISDDEEDECEEEYENDGDEQEYVSDVEEEADRLVEYDSEENEVEVKPQKEKKKRKMTEFFEQEAELTSEDEWVGSGDEDERDLDQMEREEGDDDTFNQKKLQRELGQIHMRDVLDQDKREVRIIQELLFEDGDLGDGHRQRKFRWKNADGEVEGGTVPDEFADTQEEEMESEEQWRKQRHERELFLRQMQKEDEAEENLNISINRTTIIKANLMSRTMSSLINEATNKPANEANKTTSETDSSVMLEKKTSRDIPSPKKAFTVFQQSYHGSLLTRGRGSLSRLAALATPLVADDDAPKLGSLGPSSRRNFVFAALSQDETGPKVTKRKAEMTVGTPRLVKKMKTEDKKKPRSSLLDHLKV